jgi:uncharacterized protein (TIGR03086 family)
VTEPSDAAAALGILQRVTASIGDGQLGYRTPCRDYDVASLAGHVIGSTTRISAAAGIAIRAARADSPLRRVVDTGSEALAGWRDRGVDGNVLFGGRTLAARDLLGIIALEFLVHGWDFATAVGQAFVVPDALAADVLALAQRSITAESRAFAGFDQAITIDDAASPLDRLLAFTGRQPAPVLR